jgi:sugar fermentation stimulation protein A
MENSLLRPTLDSHLPLRMIFRFPLEKTEIIKRYKRFFADVKRADGTTLTVHVPNTGPMIGAWQNGWTCYIMPKANPVKMTHGAELTQSPDGTLMGINTQIPNRLVREALEGQKFSWLKGYTQVDPEFTIGKSKLDFLVEGPGLPKCFIEVKNCSGKDASGAFFPDTRSERAVKHVEELMAVKSQGHRAVLIFIVQRADVDSLRPGDEYHPEYGKVLREAIKLGVEIYPYACEISLSEINIGKLLELKV